MYFDVPKVVRSPGYDYGHDEESRNGRGIKIDILDGYIWTPERFRRSLEPREVYGPYWAHVGGREKEEGRPPFPFSFPLFLLLLLVLLPNTSTPSFPLQIRLGKKGGNLLGVGFPLPMARPPLGRPPPPSH